MTYKVQKIFVNPRHALFKALDNYAFLSKNLYNSVLYRHRQDYKEGKKKIIWNLLVNEFRATNQQDFRAIPSNMAALIVKAVDDEYKSYFAKRKAGLKANLPRYKHKSEGWYKLIFGEKLISKKALKKGYLKLTTPESIKEELNFKLPKITDITTVKQVTVTKFNDGYMINIICKVEDEVKDKQGIKVAAIDLGLSNLVACVSNNEMKHFLISGKPINSFNHFWNREIANLRSKLDEGEKKALRDKINKLNRKRNFKVNDYLHKVSRKLVNHLDSNQINSLIIGYNQGWKQDINLGKKVNQKFCYLPFYKFLQMVTYKCEDKGITVKIQEESYTSKCSFLDNEYPEKHDSYFGKRVKRGLFRASNGSEINADINGAYNILVKAIGKFNYRPIQVCGLPSTLRVGFK